MDIEQLVLSGKLNTGHSRSSSPARSNGTPRSDSPGSKWPPGEFDEGTYNQSDVAQESSEKPHESIGMGPGRTGVKGVIRDRAEAVAKANAKRSLETSALNRKMEAVSLAQGGKTWAEDEDARRVEQGLEPIHTVPKGHSQSRFGYLREVGAANFVDAVEEKQANVLVHIYDPVSIHFHKQIDVNPFNNYFQYLDRCAELDKQLALLARTSPATKFIRVRATAIVYALKKETGSLGPSSSSKPPAGDVEKFVVSEESDFGAEDDIYDYIDDEPEADLDMLPTMLVYQGGELLHTWIRVDWEAGQDGIENLLFK